MTQRNLDSIISRGGKTGAMHKNSASGSEASVRDFRKRRFLKGIGVIGVGALIAFLLPKKAQALVFGSSMRGPDPVGLKDSGGTTIDPATEAKQDNIITELQKTIGFEIPAHNYIALTYVAAGNGVGEIETVTFKTGGSGGTTVATLTLTYNASNKIATVTKT